ncbi:MAG: prevent-host-death family protein [Candidatus Binatia bacterium]|jgi:prevent-host-death family protein
MKTVTVHEAKTHLSKLLAEVEQGNEITICRGAVPVAQLTGLKTTAPARPKVGEITSKPIHYDDDCFASLSDDDLKDWGL